MGIAALVSSLFWTYGIAHYEPRYMTLVFLSISISILSFLKPYLQKKGVLMAFLFVACIGIIHNTRERLRLDRESQALVKLYDQQVKRVCDSGATVVVIPYNLSRFSAFPYYLRKGCAKQIQEITSPELLKEYPPSTFLKNKIITLSYDELSIREKL
jgi:hypothetical protein